MLYISTFGFPCVSFWTALLRTLILSPTTFPQSQRFMKEKPRKRPRLPPNSATLECKGYIRRVMNSATREVQG